MEYDENDAIEFIVKKIGIEIEEDEILNIIDIIWDYYEIMVCLIFQWIMMRMSRI